MAYWDITIIASPYYAQGESLTSFKLLQSASSEEAVERDGVGYLRAEWVKSDYRSSSKGSFRWRDYWQDSD